ncbi:hypothetical protein ACF06X_26845 [Streptomyces sp. NPDC015346]|uniref:hypothetical protein n=1 Tax=Streptomyces sp. NPDC015346 TaxID=3364954 RepID=UPI0036F68419
MSGEPVGQTGPSSGHVRPDAAGADTRDGTQLNLNGEYFVIKNITTRAVNTNGYVPDITTNTYGRALPSYSLPAGAKAYVHTGSGRHYRDSGGAHHIYRGYTRHVLLNTATAKNPDLRLKRPGSLDDSTSADSISSCNWNTAADGTTYARQPWSRTPLPWGSDEGCVRAAST